jgi:hypothetical protein
MTTWSGVGGEDIEDRTTIHETGNRLYPGDTDSAVMQLATTFTEALEAHGTPFAEVCEFLELESESAELEELFGKS